MVSVFLTVLLALLSCRVVLIFDKMVYVQVLATFCTTVGPGGAKSAQTYQPPEPIISISGYFPTCYSLNLHGISY